VPRQLDRGADLLDVHAAALAGGHVGLEALALAGGERSLVIVGDELDELAARQFRAHP
jgi:hypothetical protein